MGFAKNQMMEQEERGYGSIDKLACHNCVGNEALKAFIIETGSEEECDYCGCSDTCVCVEDLLKKIVDGIYFEYARAVDELGWVDGSYVGSTWDKYDLLHDELFDEMDFKDELFEDICDTINDETWCERDPYGLRESQGRIFMWNEFCRMVKTKMRYVFFRMPEKDRHQEEAAYLILDHISEKVADMKLIEKVPVGNSFYRGRMHDSTIMLTTADELGSPPNNKAKSNRMSAEGISVFYGADNIKTAISEIYDSRFVYASVAPFVNTKELLLLDLTKIENIPFPSLFDEERREYRETILFLRELNKNLTRPIESMENIEYVPAQIIAEYFRFLYKYNDQSIDGIAYRSSKNKEGICYVLFFDHEQCLEDKGDRLFPTTQMMKIKDSEIKTYKVNTDIQYSISL